LALIDLRFADDQSSKAHDCSRCHEATKQQRKCFKHGFDNLKKPRKMNKESLALTFCHGKATWFEEPAKIFKECYIAMQTGILPKSGSLEDQSDIFCHVFFDFVDYYKQKEKKNTWDFVIEIVQNSLEALAKMFSKIFGGK